MENSKLLKILSSFTSDEFKSFRRRVKFSAGSRAETGLLGYLAPYHPIFPTDQVTKTLVFKKLFPNTPYDDNKLRHLQLLLTKQAESFISQEIQTDNFTKQFALIRYYLERNLEKFFSQELKNIRETLSQNKFHDSVYFLKQFLVDECSNKFIKAKQRRTLEPNIQSLSDNLDSFFMLNKLAIHAEALNYQNIVKTTYTIGSIQTLFNEIANNKKLSIPAILIRQIALKTLTDRENEQHFFDLKKMLLTYHSEFSREDTSDLNTFARNYCINRINRGNSKFTRHLFELYQFEISSIPPDDDYELQPATYKNAVTLAFNLHEVDWALHCIRTFSKYLPESQREPNFTYNMARYYFIKKEYGEVIRLLSRVQYNDLFMMLSVKMLLLKTYFELNEVGPFDALVHSFRSLLRKKSTIGYYHANYSNFVKYANLVFKKGRFDRNYGASLLVKIKETKALAEREWLEDKLI